MAFFEDHANLIIERAPDPCVGRALVLWSVPLRVDANIRKNDIGTARAPAPIAGWTLEPLMRLDRGGARGLVSDLMVSSPLRRQTAFAVAAAALKHGQSALDALCVLFGLAASDESVGQILRQRRARDVIGALYSIQPSAVPGGYLRALLRVQEPKAESAGIEPFAQPTAYRRLFEIYTQDGHGPAAHAIRFVGRLRALHLRAVDELDPVLILPEVLKGIHGSV